KPSAHRPETQPAAAPAAGEDPQQQEQQQAKLSLEDQQRILLQNIPQRNGWNETAHASPALRSAGFTTTRSLAARRAKRKPHNTTADQVNNSCHTRKPRQLPANVESARCHGRPC